MEVNLSWKRTDFSPTDWQTFQGFYWPKSEKKTMYKKSESNILARVKNCRSFTLLCRLTYWWQVKASPQYGMESFKKNHAICNLPMMDWMDENTNRNIIVGLKKKKRTSWFISMSLDFLPWVAAVGPECWQSYQLVGKRPVECRWPRHAPRSSPSPPCGFWPWCGSWSQTIPSFHLCWKEATTP